MEENPRRTEKRGWQDWCQRVKRIYEKKAPKQEVRRKKYQEQKNWDLIEVVKEEIKVQGRGNRLPLQGDQKDEGYNEKEVPEESPLAKIVVEVEKVGELSEDDSDYESYVNGLRPRYPTKRRSKQRQGRDGETEAEEKGVKSIQEDKMEEKVVKSNQGEKNGVMVNRNKAVDRINIIQEDILAEPIWDRAALLKAQKKDVRVSYKRRCLLQKYF